MSLYTVDLTQKCIYYLFFIVLFPIISFFSINTVLQKTEEKIPFSFFVLYPQNTASFLLASYKY
jgi:hypothetical protein